MARNRENKIKGSLLLSRNVSLLYHQLEGMERVSFMDAVFDYHEKGLLPKEDVGRFVLMAFYVFKTEYDENQAKYKEKCERYRNNSLQRFSNGSPLVTTDSNGSPLVTTEGNNKGKNNGNNTPYNIGEIEGNASLFHHTPSDRFIKCIDFLKEKCPHLQKMVQPTEEQFFKLLEKVDGDAQKLADLFERMENDVNTPKKRRSIYRTAINWLNMETKK